MLNILFKIKINKYKKQIIKNLLPSSDSLCITKIQQLQQKPLLIIANDGYSVKRLFDEISFFAPNLKVAIFASNEILPYEQISPQKELIAERLRVLWQISHNQLDIVIIQANTLQSKICPKEYLLQRLFILNIGDKITIGKLKTQLIESNYFLVEQVYEAGEFAIRGSIIDIMPMGTKQLIRIELFDDEIETLKLIDYNSKELLKNLEKFELIPAREFPTDSESLKNFAAKFNSYFPNHSVSLIIKDLNHGMIPAGANFYLPLFFSETASIFDYIDTSWQIFYYQKTFSELETNWQEINKRYEFYNKQYPCLKPKELFLPTEDIFAKLGLFKTFIIEEFSGDLHKESDESKVMPLPDLIINSKLNNPLANLINFKKHFKGTLIVVVESFGRMEIIRQNLEKHNINLKIISSLDDIGKNKLCLIKASLHNGFISEKFAFITEHDLYRNIIRPNDKLHKRYKKSNTVSVENDSIIRDLAEIQVGDYIVHINYGIGKYLGLSIQKIAEIEYEMIELEYQNNAKLFIPVSNLHLISRYSKLEGMEVEPHKLGSNIWNKVKEKTEKRIKDVATELLELYAKRELLEGNKFSLPEEYKFLKNSFGYEPTPDQETAFNAVIQDMLNKKPMDRLICGDVGFGKTEIAIRAAFICAMNEKQVAVLAPTTLLVEQHYHNFINRFASFPIKIAEVSRFKSKKEIKETLELVKEGKIDILIGTHRIIQNDVQFKNLGLVIIDEEHRFGVKQKEKLKQMRANVDFLAMTATPIPRTLSMALEGIRDFSIIATPPSRRLSINTVICSDDKQTIREAILREIRRGGQVFFLYNDVATINKMYDRLTAIMPELRIAIAHGQMNEQLLEQTIHDFVKQRYNLLLCSTIIETGIDIPNANTIIIYNANKFGLAPLYQLRGRVGRSHHQAYCYLIIPEKISSDAEKRLEALKMTTELGSGFNLALHDLEIRGAGEILGDSQSGNVKEVGISLYTDMLKKAIKKIKKGDSLNSLEMEIECEVNLNISSIIPKDYCHSIHERLIFYKRLAKAINQEEIDIIYQDIIDKCGLPPVSVKNLIELHRFRIKATHLGVVKLDVRTKSIVLTFIDKAPIEPIKLVTLIKELKTCKFDGKNKLIWTTELKSAQDKIEAVNYILNSLEN